MSTIEERVAEDKEITIPSGLAFVAKVQEERISDTVIQARHDSRTLATIALYFYNQGYLARSAVEVVRLGLELLRMSLQNSGLVEEILSVDSAVEYLGKLGLSRINPSGRGMSVRFKQLQRETLEIQGLAADPAMPLKTKTGMNKALAEARKAEIQQSFGMAAEAYNRIVDLDKTHDTEAIKARAPKGFIVSSDDIVESGTDKLSKSQLEVIRAQRDKEQIEELKQGLGVIPRNIIAKEEQEDDEQAGDESGNER